MPETPESNPPPAQAPNPPGSDEALVLPAYAEDAGNSNAAFTAVSNDLFYRDRDARLVRVFQSLCQYAQQHKDARMRFDAVLRWMLAKGNAGTTVELSLHHALSETLVILERAGYVHLVREGGAEDPDTIELRDPMEGRITEWLSEQYGVVTGQATDSTRIVRAGSFPTLSQVVTRFNLPAEQAKRLFLEVAAGDFNEPFFQKHPDRLIMLSFHEGPTKPFDIVLPPGTRLWSFFRFAVGLLKEHHDAHARFTEEVRQRLKAIPEMNLVTLDHIFQGLLGTGDIIPEQKYLHWAHAVRTIALSPDFRTQAERAMSGDAAAFGEGDRITHLAQAAAFVHHALMNAREFLKQRQWEKEAESEDRKRIHHFLIEESRHQVALPGDESGGASDAVFYPVPLDVLGALKDHSGQFLLKDKYSDKHLVELLRAEAGEGVPPVIRIVAGEQVVFFHRYRLMNILYAETAAETHRVLRKLAADWAALPVTKIPDAKNFKIGHEQLSPLYGELLTYTYYVLDAYPTSQELVKVLFPQASDVAPLKLSQSDLVWTAENSRGRPKPQERCQQFHELFYTSSWGVTRRPLAEVLGIDYDMVLEEMKGVRKNRKGGPVRLDNLLDVGLYRFLTGTLNSIWKIFHFISGMFTGREPDPSIDDHPAQAYRKPAARAAKAAEEAPRRNFSISQAADRFGVPPSRRELKDRIEHALKEWNVVILDPKSMYPDWGRMRPDEKERLRKKLDGDARSRMAQAQDKIDRAIQRTYEHLDLDGLPAAKLTEIATDLAKQFRSNNLAPLVNYIRDSIIYLNTSE